MSEEILGKQKDSYKHFMRMEPRQTEGPVHIDPKSGWRYQHWSIGMVRNAASENRKRVKVFLDPIPHIVIDKAKPLQGWYKAKFEPPGVRPRPCYTESILTEPYGGSCAVMCSFCYINAGMRGYRAQGLTTVPKGYGEQVRAQLKRMNTATAGYFSSFIDPFLPLESYYHNTQRGAEAFVAEGLPVYFLSRLLYPGWTYDLLKKNKYSYAQMSLNTPSPKDWRILSPKAASLSDLLDQVRALHKAGIYISIQVNPIVAGITTNEDICALIHILADRGADHLIFKFVEQSYSFKPDYIRKMVQQFGDRGREFERLFTCNIGGQVTIDEEYRINAHRQFSRECKRAGVTMALCYEYRFRRDKQGNILDRTGVSMGGEFLTADQCHGHRVPLFTRLKPGAPFREVEECPPQGCLTCGGEDGVGACGSELYSQARALRFSDLKVGVYDKAPAPPPPNLVQIQPGRGKARESPPIAS